MNAPALSSPPLSVSEGKGARAVETPPGGKLVFLESVRGLAALVVVMSHFMRAFYPPFFDKTAIPPVDETWLLLFKESPLRWVLNGHFAVQLFFVLSGYVLSISFFRSFDPQVVSSAAVRRYFRLLLPVLTSVMLAWMFQSTGAFCHREAADGMDYPASAWLRKGAAEKQGWKDAAIQGAFDVFFRYDEDESLNTSLWTMQYELAGSFFVFALLVLFGRNARRYLVYAVLLWLFWTVKNHTLLNFLCGIVLCDSVQVLRRRGWQLRFPLWAALLLVALALLLAGLTKEWALAVAGWEPPYRKHWETIGAVLLLLGALGTPLFQRILSWRPLAILGEISFALYVVHWPLLVSLGCGVYLAGRNAALAHGGSVAVTAAVYLPATFVVSWLLYRFTDLPSIKLGRVVDRWLHMR